MVWVTLTHKETCVSVCHLREKPTHMGVFPLLLRFIDKNGNKKPQPGVEGCVFQWTIDQWSIVVSTCTSLHSVFYYLEHTQRF